VYSENIIHNPNINYHVISNFDNIDYIVDGNILCSTPNQAFNDMLSDNSNLYNQALIIDKENLELFNEIKDWAVEYYDEP